MIKVTLSNEILRYISEIDKNRYNVSSVKLSKSVANKLCKNSKKKSSYASNKIEGNPLSEKQVNEVIESDDRNHFLKPEQEVRNYYLALNFLEEKLNNHEPFSKELIFAVQELVEKGASKKNKGVDVWAYTLPGARISQQDIHNFNTQYPTLTVRRTTAFHDRFLIIDGVEGYHIGASLKDAGNKCFGITKIEDADDIKDIMNKAYQTSI